MTLPAIPPLLPEIPPDNRAEMDDLDRILSLPQREVLDCERRKDGTRRWTEEAQAVIDAETAKYARPKRTSCGCRPRQVEALPGGRLLIAEEASPGALPAIPLEISVDDFAREEAFLPARKFRETVETVGALTVGQRITLPGLGSGGRFCITELNPVQAWTLREAPSTGGVFGMASVGSGKTVNGLLLPLAMPHLGNWVILIKPDQRVHYAAAYFRLREHFRVPSLVFEDGRTPEIVAGSPVLRIVPYSTLSNPKSTQMLDSYDPDGVIADECFPAATRVLTEHGAIEIGTIVERRMRVKVLSRTERGTLEWRPIVRWLKKPLPGRLVRVVHEHGSFVCTPEHKVWTEDGDYVKAETLAGKSLRELQQVVPDKGSSQLEEGLLRGVSDGATLQDAPTPACCTEAEGVPRKAVRGVRASVPGACPCQQQDLLFSSVSDSVVAGVPPETDSRDREEGLRVVQGRVRRREEGEDYAEVLQLGVCAQGHLEQAGVSRSCFCPIQEDARGASGIAGCRINPEVEAPGDNALSRVSEGVLAKVTGTYDQSLLLSRVHVLVSCAGQENRKAQAGSKEPGVIGSDESAKSDAHARCEREDDREVERAHVPVTRGEREADEAAGDALRSVGRGMGDGVPGARGPGEGALPVVASVLPCGHRAHGTPCRDRSGRGVTQAQEVEVPRSSEDRGTRVSRVVRVEVLERGGDGGFERCTGGDQAVYDLEVKGNHNYFADGVLVSNCHLLANQQSSRTLRYLRFMVKRIHEGRPVHFFCWSGSAVKKSVRDCAHLVAHALGLGSPYPIRNTVVEAWSAVMDPSTQPDQTSTTASRLRAAFGSASNLGPNVPMAFLLEPNAGIREGHRDLVIRAPGIISTRSSSISCSITIRERKAPPIPASVRKALAGVRGSLKALDHEPVRPDGDPLVDPTEQARVAGEVSSGFYGYWAFRKEDPDELIEEWYLRRKAFARDARSKILLGEPHLDSRMLCEHAAARAFQVPRYEGDLPVWEVASWPPWEAIRDRVDYTEKVRWIGHEEGCRQDACVPGCLTKDPATHPGYFLARDAAKWAKDNVGVVWCKSRALGMKIAELAGLPYHGGAPDAEAKILAEDGSRSVIASIKAHGTGRDGLQHHFHRQLIAESPSSGDMYEQLLGRLAREGQREPTVETEIYRHTAEIREAFRKAIVYAEFIEATTPNRQALLAADIDFDADAEGDG